MATTNIGQYRYAGEGLTELSFKKSYVDSNADITGLDEQNTGFKDVAIIPDKQFVKGQDYYLKVQINTTHKRSFGHGITCIYFITLCQQVLSFYEEVSETADTIIPTKIP